MNAVGFWHKPRTTAPYVCIEPWYSLPADDGIVDDLATKQLMIRLEPGRTYENSFTITVNDGGGCFWSAAAATATPASGFPVWSAPTRDDSGLL